LLVLNEIAFVKSAVWGLSAFDPLGSPRNNEIPTSKLMATATAMLFLRIVQSPFTPNDAVHARLKAVAWNGLLGLGSSL
jgi:cytochrome bd-type quinol oxidase subunit 1